MWSNQIALVCKRIKGLIATDAIRNYTVTTDPRYFLSNISELLALLDKNKAMMIFNVVDLLSYLDEDSDICDNVDVDTILIERGWNNSRNYFASTIYTLNEKPSRENLIQDISSKQALDYIDDILSVSNGSVDYYQWYNEDSLAIFIFDRSSTLVPVTFKDDVLDFHGDSTLAIALRETLYPRQITDNEEEFLTNKEAIVLALENVLELTNMIVDGIPTALLIDNFNSFKSIVSLCGVDTPVLLYSSRFCFPPLDKELTDAILIETNADRTKFYYSTVRAGYYTKRQNIKTCSTIEELCNSVIPMLISAYEAIENHNNRAFSEYECSIEGDLVAFVLNKHGEIIPLLQEGNSVIINKFDNACYYAKEKFLLDIETELDNNNRAVEQEVKNSISRKSEENFMSKSIISKIVSANKTAATEAAVLELGHTALNVAVSTAKPRIPMMLRGYTDSPFFKVVLANIAVVAVQQYAANNAKAVVVSDAMLTASMQEVLSSLDIQGIINDILSKVDSSVVSKAMLDDEMVEQ